MQIGVRGCGEAAAAVRVVDEPELGQCVEAVRVGEFPGTQFLSARLNPHPEWEAVAGDVAARYIGVTVRGDIRTEVVESVFPLLLVQRCRAADTARAGGFESCGAESGEAFGGQCGVAGSEGGSLVGDPAAECEPAVRAHPRAGNVPVTALVDVGTKVRQTRLEPLFPHGRRR